VGAATSARAGTDGDSAAAIGRGAGRGLDTGWPGATGAEGRAGGTNGASDALAGAADAGGRGASESGRLGGLGGAAGGCTVAVADAGATLVGATGGTLRGSTLEA